LTVAAFIGSLNVTFTVVVTATSLAEIPGTTAVTVGRVTSGSALVVNVEVNATRGLFARSLAPAVTLTVYTVLNASAAAGVSVAVLFVGLYEIAAETGDPPAGVSVNVEAETVDAVIASLNVTVMAELTPMFVAPAAGVTLVTVGDVKSGAAAVVNVALKGTSEFPATSCAFAFTFTV
jgi:hypothetical protein